MRRTALWIVMLTVAGLLVAASSAARAQQGPAEAPEQPARSAAAAKELVAPSEGDVTRPDKASEELQEQSLSQEQWLGQIFGWGMIPLWTCSIILLALILERRRALKPSKIVDQGMVEQVAELVGEMKVAEARAVAEQSPTVLGRAWGQAFHEFSLGGTTVAEALTNSTAVAFKPLKRNLQALATIGVISPLFGLLGTVLGMIITFGQIAATGGADKSELAGGIGLALFTTAGGLIVAIPAILSNRYFTARLTNMAERAEEAISRINYRYLHAVARAQDTGGAAADQQAAQAE